MLRLEGLWTDNGGAYAPRSRLALAASATFILMASVAFAQAAHRTDPGNPDTKEILTQLANRKK